MQYCNLHCVIAVVHILNACIVTCAVVVVAVAVVVVVIRHNIVTCTV